MRSVLWAAGRTAAVGFLATSIGLAHGWVAFQGGFTPPPLPGAAAPGGSAGSGSNGMPAAAPAPVVPAGGGATAGGGVGGGSGGAAGVGGGSSGLPVVGGGTPGPATGGETAGPPSSGGARPSTPKLPGVGRGAGVAAAPRGGNAPVARKARAEDAWMSEARIDWTAAFLPQVGAEGYGKTATTVGEALRRPAHDGGLSREPKPTLVLLYDPANKDHVAALEALDADARIRAAATCFNRFRIDAAVDAKAAPASPTLAVYSAEGELVGEAAADKRLGRAYELMESAFAKTGGDLAAAAARADAAVKYRAYAEWRMKAIEVGVVCPDCGELRHDLLAEIETLRVRAKACAAAETAKL
jgi:hypothetical protein